jgi:hypothetical protein
MRIGITGTETNIGRELVRLGVVPGTWNGDDFHIFCEEPSNKIPYIARFFHLTCNVSCPIILVSSYAVFRGKRWFWKSGYKESANQNPDTDEGFLLLGAEAIALTDNNVKIIRLGYGGNFKVWANCIMKFAQRYAEMPKILHIAPGGEEIHHLKTKRTTVLNISLAKKLGIL